jgi:hypothetical protein
VLTQLHGPIAKRDDLRRQAGGAGEHRRDAADTRIQLFPLDREQMVAPAARIIKER